MLRQEVATPWLLLVVSLPGNHGALRLRTWRSLKTLGAAMLRDGVYLMPESDEARGAFDELATEISQSGGSAFVFAIAPGSVGDEDALAALFDRTGDYGDLIKKIDDLLGRPNIGEPEARRALRHLNREFALIDATDFFPGEARELAKTALAASEKAIAKIFSPEEPVSIQAPVPRRDAALFKRQVWATRSHIWIDRMCSAWLIRRFIDPEARFLWLGHATDCPKSAIGFDFDGATFTHVEDFVTFEVLLKSFGLDADTALSRIATLVHQLDVGGGRVAEAAGFEAIMTGAREVCPDDDALLGEMSRVLDNMYRAFSIVNDPVRGATAGVNR